VRGVSALSNALRQAPPGSVSAIVVWEPVIRSDHGPPSKAVTQPLDGLDVARFYDPTLLASRAAVRTAIAHPDRLPLGSGVDATTIAWDIVATFPPGARWEQDLPWPDWFAMPVVDGEAEMTRRLAALRGTPRAAPDPQRPTR
jgi:hypothetical protein